MTRVGSLRFAAVAFAAAVSFLAPAVASAATTQHVDCQANPVGAAGSEAHPWTALADVPSVLGPGDEILLKAQTTCTGSLVVTGSGTANNRATVGTYGGFDHFQGKIVGSGEDALRLENTSYVTVEDLELTNPGDGTSKRRGLHLVASGQTVEGLAVLAVFVHDVGGNLDKDGGGSGGIQVDSEGPGLGRYDDLDISRNRVEGVSRSGIFVVGTSQGGDRPRAGQAWPEASTDVRISGNRVDSVAGDGIVVLGTDRAVINGNLVSRGNLAGRGLTDPSGLICDAGIWAFNANSTVIEGNEVSEMRFNGCDGTAFDVDYMQDGTVVQRNYSHDNQGGFLLLCTDSQPRTSQVRFNLSVNDGYSLNSSPCNEPSGSYAGIDIYNNTIVSPDPGFAVLGTPATQLYGPPSLSFFNNIVVATGNGRGFTCEPACRNNLFSGLPPAGTGAISADPKFAVELNATTADPEWFKLGPGSPAFEAGVPVPEDAHYDYFGQFLEGAPNIGFDFSRTSSVELSHLRVEPRAFRAKQGRGRSIVQRGGAADIRLRSGAPTRVVFRITRKRDGKTRNVPGKFHIETIGGTTKRSFSGRLSGKPLPPGRYRLEAPTPRGDPISTAFKIKPPAR